MRTLVALTALVLLLPACDSADGDPAAAARELELASARVDFALTEASTGTGSDGSFSCARGGTASYQLTDTGGRITFNGCADITGTLDLQFGGFDDDPPRFRQRIDGSVQVRNSCAITYDAFETGFAIDDIESDTPAVNVTFDGRLAADCPSGRTTCAFDGATFSLGTGARPDFERFCR